MLLDKITILCVLIVAAQMTIILILGLFHGYIYLRDWYNESRNYGNTVLRKKRCGTCRYLCTIDDDGTLCLECDNFSKWKRLKE